ncbi:RNA polymerase II holoenzyme cyclin-like subunit [Coemansia sp. RSA 2322]|nr:RNA polymerase II holoenzyme cyclin-like subunit [Coemansia sp. RSA 2322]
MAANYWESSQFQRFMLTRFELAELDSMHMLQLTSREITHIKIYFSSQVSPDIRFPYDVPDIAECESYLLEEMKFYLVVYHPYQVLLDVSEQIKLPKPSLQAAWSIINDSYQTDAIFVYPPHVIAVAAMFLSRVVDQGSQSDVEAQQWFADLNVDITDVLQVVSDLLVLYGLWNTYSEEKMPELVYRYIADIAASN